MYKRNFNEVIVRENASEKLNTFAIPRTSELSENNQQDSKNVVRELIEQQSDS